MCSYVPVFFSIAGVLIIITINTPQVLGLVIPIMLLFTAIVMLARCAAVEWRWIVLSLAEQAVNWNKTPRDGDNPACLGWSSDSVIGSD
jgi:hypothetical protein